MCPRHRHRRHQLELGALDAAAGCRVRVHFVAVGDGRVRPRRRRCAEPPPLPSPSAVFAHTAWLAWLLGWRSRLPPLGMDEFWGEHGVMPPRSPAVSAFDARLWSVSSCVYALRMQKWSSALALTS